MYAFYLQLQEFSSIQMPVVRFQAKTIQRFFIVNNNIFYLLQYIYILQYLI